MRWLAALTLAFVVIGCGEGYHVPSATTRLEYGSTAQMEAGATAIVQKLAELGFESAPGDAALSEDMREAVGSEIALRLSRTTEFSRHRGSTLGGDREDIHASLTTIPGELDASAKSTGDALEVTVSDLRPGGFSPGGLRVHAELAALLREQDARLTVVSSPAVDEREHDRISLVNTIASVVWWTVAWIVFMAIIGSLSDWAMRRSGVTRPWRQAVLVLIGLLIVTPMPQQASIFSILMPGIFLLTGGFEYITFVYHNDNAQFLGAYAASLMLSVLVALYFIRGRDGGVKVEESVEGSAT